MVSVGSYAFDREIARLVVAKMIVLHEYSLVMVYHIGFREFCAALQPLFKVVSRNTIKTDIMKIFMNELETSRKLLSKNQSRIAITTDLWTANNQNKSYMTVTAHFVDDSWILQSRLVRFIYVPTPHQAKVLADVLLECLMDWNLDTKLSTVIVDNCSTNDAMIRRVLDKISPRLLILGGQLLHMKCYAHILNLIVKDVMSIISNVIENVRESVEYWTATPKREEKFIQTCGQVNISYSKKLILDCKTRWNSTFLGWWKANGLQYPILQLIAKCFLAILISSVASESSFSTSGRVLTPHRSRLRSDTLEAMMCLQDWLWTTTKDCPISKAENIKFNKVVEDADVDPTDQSCAATV